MPIDLTKIVKNPTNYQKTTSYRPTYFHRDLTGAGKKIGLINSTNNTINDSIKNIYDPNFDAYHLQFTDQNKHLLFYADNQVIMPDQNHYKIVKTHHYDLSVMSLINQNFRRISIDNQHITAHFKKMPHFLSELPYQELATYQDHTIKASLLFDHVTYHEYNNNVKSNNHTKFTSFGVHTNLVVMDTNPKATVTTVNIINTSDSDPLPALENYININHPNDNHNQIIVLTNLNVYHDFQTISRPYNLLSVINQALNKHYQESHDLDFSKLLDQSLVDTLKAQAETTDKYFVNDFVASFKFYDNLENKFNTQRDLLQHAYHLIQLVEHNLDETGYQRFYNRLEATTLKKPSYHQAKYDTYHFNRLISINTRLSLTHQLNQLKSNPDVYQFQPAQKVLQTKDKYSPEQLAIIHTTEPYVVGVAGAGTGKSHTLLGRLQFLQENNIDFKHVLVTSFTNTAAQNIINRFKHGINSLTNANLFHKIYQANFNHQLTSDLTIANFLSTLPSNSKFMKSTSTMNDTRESLITLLRKSIKSGFQKVDPRSITENLIALINERLDDTIKILNAIKQTSLLLEPIIINALMQNNVDIKFPENLKNLDFIITDESQDTSAFEYVLLLELTKLNNAQLMIIGDANQTLYEFRNANPEFLNALERSDVFKTYTMSTNYRSQQSVLTVANEVLSVLETNRTAKIQLHANLYQNVTKTSFKNDIAFANIIPESAQAPVASGKHLDEVQRELKQAVKNSQTTVQWILDRYRNNEQIAIMAYRNRDTQAIGAAVSEIIQSHFGATPTIGYTRSPQQRENTWLSQMLGTTEDRRIQQAFFRTHHLTADEVRKSLLSRLDYIARRRRFSNGSINNFAMKTVTDLCNSSNFKAHLNALNAGKIGYNKFNGFITTKLINAETSKNNIARLMQNNEDTHWQDKDIVISTIHSAKGLEFPSAICYFDETMRHCASQENLRLFGVALTRAEQHELILNQPKVNVKHGLRLPTPTVADKIGMFEMPMRTAYQRVLNRFNTTVPDPNASATPNN